MKHKHADLIHAWADGEVIQFKDIYGIWTDCPNNQPNWGNSSEYRIKPKEKCLYLAFSTSLSNYHSSSSHDLLEDYDHVVKIHIDGSTGLATSMEVIK